MDLNEHTQCPWRNAFSLGNAAADQNQRNFCYETRISNLKSSIRSSNKMFQKRQSYTVETQMHNAFPVFNKFPGYLIMEMNCPWNNIQRRPIRLSLCKNQRQICRMEVHDLRNISCNFVWYQTKLDALAICAAHPRTIKPAFKLAERGLRDKLARNLDRYIYALTKRLREWNTRSEIFFFFF